MWGQNYRSERSWHVEVIQGGGRTCQEFEQHCRAYEQCQPYLGVMVTLEDEELLLVFKQAVCYPYIIPPFFF